MAERVNGHGQAIGPALPDWTAREPPPASPMEGGYARVERLDVGRHARDLFETHARAPDDAAWTYLGTERSADPAHHRGWLESVGGLADPFFQAIVDRATGRALGVAAFLRIDPANGVIEIGHIHFGHSMQRSRIGTEAVFLMMRRAFDELGYRRLEWKCDALNGPSRRAALRFGFTEEGVFRQAVVVKGRNRDTAWFSIVDRDWAPIRAGFEAWLEPANFDPAGVQLRRLGALIADARGPEGGVRRREGGRSVPGAKPRVVRKGTVGGAPRRV